MLKITACQNCLNILGDKTRAKIIGLLAQKSPQTVSEIVKHFKLRQPTISHHLAILKKAKFISQEKKGLEVFYSLNKNCHITTTCNCHLLQT